MAMSTITDHQTPPGQPLNEPAIVPGYRLGRGPSKSSPRSLSFSQFFQFAKLPASHNPWTRRKPIPIRDYGNRFNGCCTIAKQAIAAIRMERLEGNHTIAVTEEEVLRVYYAMTDRLYGGGDTGAYEMDALNNWRNPELTFRATDGNPYTIDGYLRINPYNHEEVKAALFLSGAQGIAVCVNLPLAFQGLVNGEDWDVPANQQFTGIWTPGSWGGHSMWEHGYAGEWGYLDQTWLNPINRFSWRAKAAYMDEAHMVVDSVNVKRAKAAAIAKDKTLSGAERKMATEVRNAYGHFADAVNASSDILILVD